MRHLFTVSYRPNRLYHYHRCSLTTSSRLLSGDAASTSHCQVQSSHLSSHLPLHAIAFYKGVYKKSIRHHSSSTSHVGRASLQDNGLSLDVSLERTILQLQQAFEFEYTDEKFDSSVSKDTLEEKNQSRKILDDYEFILQCLYEDQLGDHTTDRQFDTSAEGITLFLSPDTTSFAFRTLLRCGFSQKVLSDKIRKWEQCIGSLGQTPLTDELSLRMLQANGEAGNIGRALTILSVRTSRGYIAQREEFIYATTAIRSAGLYLEHNRNIFLGDKDQPQIDDPTRWLDAILMNMSQRNFPLTTELANRMLHTFASTGKSGKAQHHFYRVLRSPIDESSNDLDEEVKDKMAHFRNKPVHVRMSMRPPPPYHKIPSQVKGKLVHKPGSDVKQLKLDRESDPDWSLPLTAAITFADSLKQGACGHEPIELDLVSYSTLMHVCVNRGSCWRAMHILDEVMPSNGIEPDAIAYNTLLFGLARVGDAPTMKEYFNNMHANNIQPTGQTVEAIVTGLLNLGDIATAITFVQDCFNQHSVLPPYTIHLKILETALARGLVYEAKRHLFVIQQLMKWERNEYHSDSFCELMEVTQNNPSLSKEALQDLFAYFGEKLDDSDFL